MFKEKKIFILKSTTACDNQFDHVLDENLAGIIETLKNKFKCHIIYSDFQSRRSKNHFKVLYQSHFNIFPSGSVLEEYQRRGYLIDYSRDIVIDSLFINKSPDENDLLKLATCLMKIA